MYNRCGIWFEFAERKTDFKTFYLLWNSIEKYKRTIFIYLISPYASVFIFFLRQTYSSALTRLSEGT